MQKEVLGHVVYFTAGALIGASVTYFLTKKAIEKRAFDLAEEEIHAVKETYNLIRSSKRTEEEERQRTHEYLEVLDRQQYAAQSEEPEEFVEENLDAVHEESEDVTTWDRSRDEPYVISTDEYMNDADEYDKLVLTYFEADNTLVDEADTIIPDVEGTVGAANLLNFGAGSKDKNVVYIRNDRQENDYEVIRNMSSYSQVVLGIEEWDARDVRRPKQVRKMRDGS